MSNILLNKLKDDIDKKIKEIGGIENLNKCETANEIITGWIKDIILILAIQEYGNRFDMKIKNINYTNCYFKVSFYETNYKAMCIVIYGTKQIDLGCDCYPICNCTIYNSKVDYQKNIIALKEEYVPLFEELQIISKIKSKMIVPLSECRNMLDYADKEFYICEINQETLKKFCKDWNYKYE